MTLLEQAYGGLRRDCAGHLQVSITDTLIDSLNIHRIRKRGFNCIHPRLCTTANSFGNKQVYISPLLCHRESYLERKVLKPSRLNKCCPNWFFLESSLVRNDVT
jgi:hypothetical protein